MTKMVRLGVKQGLKQKKEAEAYLKLYKEKINKCLNAIGKAKTRESFQVFQSNNKSMIEEKKRKYGHYHHISAIS
jgi:hypothetical protein